MIIKTAIDAPLATLAVTSPWWVQALQTGSGIVLTVGGVVLVGLRIALAIREWHRGRAR